MSGSINFNASNAGINVSSNYNEEEIRNETKKKGDLEVQQRQAPMQSPTTDLAKTAQTSTDIVVASGKNLNQIVLENNAPRKEEISKDDNTINKNLSSLSTQSAIGATTDINALPPEIQTRNDVE